MIRHILDTRSKVKWLEDLQCSLKEYGWKGIKLYVIKQNPVGTSMGAISIVQILKKHV